MPNVYLDPFTVRDIDAIVGKILHDLDNPEPPLRLELVRELLRLDQQYYSSTETGVLQETVHRLRVAGQQLIHRPTLLLDVVRTRRLSALWIPDRRRILIDTELPAAKVRWAEAHEISHSVVPWHEAMAHGDERRTLSLACELRLEAEANFAAGRLLFLQDRFIHQLLSADLTIEHVRSLASAFGNTITSTLWRSIESTSQAAFALLSQHPRADMADAGEPLVRYFIRSRSFEQKYAAVTELDLYHHLRGICWGKRGPIGQGEIEIRDGRGDTGVFHLECFYNGYDALTIGKYVRPRALAVPIARAGPS